MGGSRDAFLSRLYSPHASSLQEESSKFNSDFINTNRYGTAQAYLLPALNRHNLSLETDAQVIRLEFDRDRVTGVTYIQICYY
ncbi:MAG: GMC family oxidoreductase N-terminal domain-containing protein [Hydrococcus sp. Prado102]|jgi:hypothetical protein|nr:GMC family oxidoreductase N-terminal domain-containing protein [Hydrococcus sp. Prado102]